MFQAHTSHAISHIEKQGCHHYIQYMRKQPIAQVDPALQKKLRQQALKAIALKYDLRPSQVRIVRGDILHYMKQYED